MNDKGAYRKSLTIAVIGIVGAFGVAIVSNVLR